MLLLLVAMYQKLIFSDFILFYNSKNRHLEFLNLSPQGLISSIIYYANEQKVMPFFSTKTDKKYYDVKLNFRLTATFLRPTIFKLGLKQKILCIESISVMPKGEKH